MPETCSETGCTRKPKSRGICSAHYQVAAKLIKEGILSWEGLERGGIVEPSKLKKKKK